MCAETDEQSKIRAEASEMLMLTCKAEAEEPKQLADRATAKAAAEGVVSCAKRTRSECRVVIGFWS